MNVSTPIRLKVVCVALMAVYPALSYAGVAGRVQFVAGDVRVVDAQGKEHPLRKGEDINEGDTVVSAGGGTAQLRMIDGAVVAVRPDTQLKVNGYAYNGKQDGSENASFSLVKGGLRAITGMIGKVNKDKYKIETPTAVIGIRGTDHEPMVVPPASAAAAAGTPPGTYDKVNVGATSLTNQAGSTVVGANQVGFAGSFTQRPTILPNVPDFYRATPAPAQGRSQEQKQEQKQNSAQQTTEQTAQSESAASTSTSSTTTATIMDAMSTLTVTGSITPPPTRITATSAGGTALDSSTQAITTPSAGMVLLAAYPIASSESSAYVSPISYFFEGPGGGLTRDAAGNVTGANGTYSNGGWNSLAQTGSAMADYGANAATGLSWGRWQGGTVTQRGQYYGMDANGNVGLGGYDSSVGQFVIGATNTFSTPLGAGSLHWIAGSGTAPDHLPLVLTGTANYSLVGATRPTDALGNAGTLNSASLTVDFTKQLVDTSLNFSIGGSAWTMTGSGMQLHHGEFSAASQCSTCTSALVLRKDGVQLYAPSPTSTDGQFATGSISGWLTGPGLNGAGLQYSVYEQSWGSSPYSSSVIQGVAAFSGPAQNIQTPFRMVGTVDGWRNLTDGGYMKNTGFAVTSSLYHGGIEGDAAPAARVVDSAAGMTEFLGQAYGYAPAGMATAPTESANYEGTSASIKIGSAVNRDVGSFTASDGTKVSWGRWEGGSIDIYSRDGSAKIGTIDNTGRSVHWVNSSVLTSTSTFTSLPLTGTATYTVAGNTSPTDLLGNTGTLTSATLTADFGNARINAGVNVSFNAPSNSGTWSMAANNIPLKGDGGFESSSTLNGVGGITHTASCSGTACGANTIGNINGALFSGGQGAVLMYGMATGTTTPATASTPSTFNASNAVSGVVVMKR